MQTADPMVKRFMTRSRKRKPPPGPGQYFIPGIGSATRQRNVAEQIRKHPHKQGDPYKVPDGGWRMPHPPRRGRTKSTPGSAYRRRKPQVN